MRNIREEFEEQDIKNKQQMFDKITVLVNSIRKNVLDGMSREEIVEQLEGLEEALS
ncbi:MAG: hypothetical protein IKH75_14150 [Ruminococcus sp.]|nr:hypothetical protein [Ruminococcus sp.]